MKRISRKNMKIIAATAMTIFSLFAVTVGAFAWFVANLQQANNADQFSVTIRDGRLKNIYFHSHVSKEINTTTLKPISYTFSSNYTSYISYDWSTNSATYHGNPIDMQDYSPLDFAQPLLMVFELTDAYILEDAGDLTIQATTDVDGFLGARDSNNAPVYDLIDDCYYSEPNAEDSSKTDYYYALSSVVDFYCNDSSSELYNKSGDTNTTLINTTYQVANLRNREMSIAAKEQDPDAVVPDLSFTSINNANDATTFNQTPTIYESLANSTVRYVSIIVDYYSDALDYIYSTYLGNDTLETEFDSHLEFICDWGLEIN